MSSSSPTDLVTFLEIYVSHNMITYATKVIHEHKNSSYATLKLTKHRGSFNILEDIYSGHVDIVTKHNQFESLTFYDMHNRPLQLTNIMQIGDYARLLQIIYDGLKEYQNKH